MAELQPANTTNTSITTVTIRPGQKVILPQGATITSLVMDGSINVESSCDNLPAPSNYKCGYFVVILDRDNDGGRAMNEQDTYIQSLKVANNTYIIGEKIVASGDGDNSTLVTISELNDSVPDQAIFSFTKIRRDTLNVRQNVYIYFKTPEELFTSVELQVNTWDTVHFYRPLEATCDLYEFGDSA